MLPSRSLRTATQIAVPGRNAVATGERRDMSPVGVARRKRFDDSLDLLRALGLSSTAVEHYRLLARKTRTVPHQLVCTMAEHAARDADLLDSVVRGAGPA